METVLAKQLQDKSYEKRKAATLELEKVVHQYNEQNEETKLQQVYQQLYDMLGSQNSTVRSGGLTGLVGVGIGLKDDISLHLPRLVPFILRACLNDTDAKSRFFAIESLYNVAKVAKGRILVYFNEIFDMMAKVNADSDASCRQAHELLDRCMRDIVADEAARYVVPSDDVLEPVADYVDEKGAELDEPKPFTLARFIPLLQDRIYVKNPFARMFFLDWIRIMISIPELELVTWLPSFLDGVLDYLNDPSKEVRIATINVLETLRLEMRQAAVLNRAKDARERQPDEGQDGDGDGNELGDKLDGHEVDVDGGEWTPGQGIQVDHAAIVEILLKHMIDFEASDDIHVLCLRWVSDLLHYCPDTVVPFTPRLIQVILPAMADRSGRVREYAEQTNEILFIVVETLPVAGAPDESMTPSASFGSLGDTSVSFPSGESPSSPKHQTLDGVLMRHAADGDLLNYQETVDKLMEQLVPEKEEGRLASAKWMSMLQRKAPEKIAIMAPVLFSVLTKFLSDQTASEEVIRSVLSLIAQISLMTSEVELRSFLGDILKIFGTDRTLLDRRGSTIIRHLCLHLNAERIYKLCAEILEREEDLEFASSMVQHLNLFLITSPELADFRRRLKVLDSKDAQALFSTLYRSWSHNAVSTLSLCFLAQAYEHSFALIQTFTELEISVSLLMQLDKLVQLLESPVFTPLRLQLLEPDRHPYLFKSLYGLLMLLPQSSAFATLRNRLSSVSALGYLHAVPAARTSVSPSGAGSTSLPPATSTPSALRSGVRKGDDAGPGIRWSDLLNHFRDTQSRHEGARPHHMATGGSTSIGLSPESHVLAISGDNGLVSDRGPPGDGSSSGSRTARRKTAGGVASQHKATTVAPNAAAKLRDRTSSPPNPGRRMFGTGSGAIRRPP